MPWLRHHNNSIPYIVCRSARAKLLRLEWRPFGAKCVAPLGVSSRDILKFLFKHASWLDKQARKEALLLEGKLYHWPRKIKDGCLVPYMGSQLKVEITPLLQGTVERRGRLLLVSNKIKHRDLERNIVDWLKKRATRYALHWSKKITRNFGYKPRSIVVKDQKSRWGSCGIHDDIYLNWRLMCCPRRVFMYVVVHEHSHLKHRNHGKRFWGLVGKMMVDYEIQDKWLSRYGCFLNN